MPAGLSGSGSLSLSLGPEASEAQAQAVARQALLAAMARVQLGGEGGEGPSYAPDSRFAMLNEMTAGQEEVDDIIGRDVHRTFPECAAFATPAMHASLFRVLKA